MWLDTFRNDPKAALFKSKLSIRTSPKHSAAGVYHYHVDETDPKGEIIYIGPNGTTAPFSAFIVPVQQESSYSLSGVPSDGSVSILLTTQMTACAFIINKTDTGIEVGHLQPPKTTKSTSEGSNLETRLDQEGYSKVYGLNSYFGSTASVIGLFKDGRWTIYGQQFNGSIVCAVKILHQG